MFTNLSRDCICNDDSDWSVGFGISIHNFTSVGYSKGLSNIALVILHYDAGPG